MQTGYYDAIGGMATQFNKLDVISNNLANLNTAGFKQDKSIIADFQRLYQEKRDILNLNNNTVEGSKYFNRAMTKVPQISEVYTDFRSGNLKSTNLPLDLALKDNSHFFLVQVGDEIQLTRNGTFSMDNQSNLVNQDGYKVLDSDKNPIKILSGDDIVIDSDGIVYVDNEYSGELFVGYVDNMKKLAKVGNSNLSPREQVIHHSEQSGVVAQGYLEQSNVNPVFAMSEMIATNRLLEMGQKVASSQMDDMNNEAINKIAVNR